MYLKYLRKCQYLSPARPSNKFSINPTSFETSIQLFNPQPNDFHPNSLNIAFNFCLKIKKTLPRKLFSKIPAISTAREPPCCEMTKHPSQNFLKIINYNNFTIFQNCAIIPAHKAQTCFLASL